jgi:uncharacterized protein
MPPDRGLFLETTWRLHPELCAYTSEVVLRRPARAGAAPGRQRLIAATAPRRRTGPRHRSTGHVGADNESPDEAAAVAGLAGRSSTAARLDRPEGVERPDRLGRRPDRRAVQRPGRDDPAPAADRLPGSERSTSSRARRRRSASTR